MTAKTRSPEEIQQALKRLRVRRVRNQDALREVFAEQNALWVEGNKAGLSGRLMAKISGVSDGHVSNVLTGKNLYAARPKPKPKRKSRKKAA